ncbi:MAG: FKBP-type peptidyl-prolyl cis-trans isomerase [Arenimonas sp.]|uniref:FKBP-type peptidyl-prolyl cis-trans isomerase N-terminal domain-containing protein n=1 Tax=Arenimonas sp. TaxID=1872635 RepID=UPI0025C543A3|nr:FKBP-type peptidyl-prolyl cis-trans isomerase N-terminal domain-containing protein [Arenimonas sp.]MBW8367600.1 FKBP-type peptidyl-prolyl cis-trans isomerase [Arenimonas sp.]
MKLRLLAASLAALGLSAGVAVAQTAPAQAPQAQQAPAPVAVNKPVLSYAIGYDLGKDLSQQGVDVDINAVIKALQDGFAKRAAQYPQPQLDAQLAGLQQRMMTKARSEFEKVANENKAKSDAFLAANRAKPGVTTLPTGVQYRVIEPGTGAKPTLANTVAMHYRGSVSTGQEFANTYAQQNPTPATFKLSEFPIKGVQEVLLMMPSGSRWEVFLPADKAFGNDPRSPVGPGQALVFDIKLVSVQ